MNLDETRSKEEEDEERYDFFYGDDEDEEEEDEDYDDTSYDDDTVSEEESVQNESIGTVYAAVLYSKASRNVGGSEGAVGTSFFLDQVKSEDLNSKFRVNLYDYFIKDGKGEDSTTGKDRKWKYRVRDDSSWFPHYVTKYYDDINDKTGYFNFVYEPETDGNNQNSYTKKNNVPINITQGLAKKSYTDREGSNFLSKFSNIDLYPNVNVQQEEDHMRSYPNVQLEEDFFTRDKEGYYIYNSSQSGATYNKSTNKLSASGTNSNGGFWPFDSQNKRDYFHGMHLGFDFSVLNEGKVKGEDMIFEFQGDDDIWVYLTDKNDKTKEHKLALDIGGIHGAMTGRINFATGEITYENESASEREKKGAVIGRRFDTNGTPTTYYKESETGRTGSDPIESPKSTTFYLYTSEDALKQYKAENVVTEEAAQQHIDDTYNDYVGLERSDLSELTLDFYIMDRGAGSSNCYLKFNIPAIPKDSITVYKNVVSSSDDDKNATYNYELWTGTNATKLEKSAEFSIKPSENNSWTSEAFPEGTYFQVVEKDAKGASKITWKTGSGFSGTGPTSEVYKVTTDTNSILFTNIFDLSPQVGKKAIRDETDHEKYIINLEVSGATMEEIVPNSTTNDKITYYLENVNAQDVLSDYVEFDTTGDYPEFTVSSEDGSPKNLKTDDGKNYYIDNSSETILTVAGKKINWEVTGENGNLKEKEKKTLSFPVKVTAIAYGNSSYTDSGDTNTGTHEGELGYFSNINENHKSSVSAGNTASDKVVQKDFPKPVVRPGDLLSLTLEKKVENAETIGNMADTVKFPFKVVFSGGGGRITAVQDGKTLTPTVAGDTTTFDNIQLSNGSNIKFDGIARTASYTISEMVGRDFYYDSDCKKIQIDDDVVDKKSGMPTTILGSIEGNMTVTNGTQPVSGNKTVTFTNILIPRTTGIQIKKNLIKADSEENTFLFTIKNIDRASSYYGQEFHASVTVEAGKMDNSIIIYDVPVSHNYQVTEAEHMRYTQTEVNPAQTDQNTIGKINTEYGVATDPSTVTFTNEKTSTGYFSSTHVAVNKIEGDTTAGFKMEGNYPGREPTPEKSIPVQELALLPTDNSKKFVLDDGTPVPDPTADI